MDMPCMESTQLLMYGPAQKQGLSDNILRACVIFRQYPTSVSALYSAQLNQFLTYVSKCFRGHDNMYVGTIFIYRMAHLFFIWHSCNHLFYHLSILLSYAYICPLFYWANVSAPTSINVSVFLFFDFAETSIVSISLQSKLDVAVHGRDLYLGKPTLGQPKKFQHSIRSEEVVITRLRIVHTKATISSLNDHRLLVTTVVKHWALTICSWSAQ